MSREEMIDATIAYSVRGMLKRDVSGGDETVPGAVSLGDDGRDVREAAQSQNRGR